MASEVDPNSPLVDSEIVFRRVPPEYCDWTSDRPRPSKNAFKDGKNRPSVDRALLRKPEETQEKPENGVRSLLVETIRALPAQCALDKKGRETDLFHRIDVEPMPIEGNPAHAEIALIPATKADSIVRRMRERLAQLGEWEILPTKPDPAPNS